MLSDKALMAEYIVRVHEEKNIDISIDDETGCW